MYHLVLIKSQYYIRYCSDGRVRSYFSPCYYWALEDEDVHAFNLGEGAHINNGILAGQHAEVQRCMLKKAINI